MLVSSSRKGGKFPQRAEYLHSTFVELGYEVLLVEGFNPISGAWNALKNRDVRFKIFSGYRAGAAAILLKLSGPRYIYDCVERKSKLCRDNWKGPKRALIPFVERMEEWMIRGSKTTTTATLDVFEWAKSLKKEVVLAPNGYDSKLFDPSKYEREELRRKYSVDFPLLIYVGKLTPMYAIYIEPVIDAMGIIQNTLPEARFWVYGDGPEMVRLRDLAKRREVKVEFKGYIEHDLVPEVVTIADVGINAYHHESLKMKEWFAMGLPVLAPEGVLDDNVIISGWKPNELASSILGILKDPRRKIVKTNDWYDTTKTLISACNQFL
jgi:glycosyltransferase involved in cell wall biosynthesis